MSNRLVLPYCKKDGIYHLALDISLGIGNWILDICKQMKVLSMPSARTSQVGFTLIEFIIYFALAGIVVFILSLFLQEMLSSRVKTQSILTVEQQGQQIMQSVVQATRNAKAITSPAAGSSSQRLELEAYDQEENPTVFDFDGGLVRICEGGGCAQVALNSSEVVISNFLFENLSRQNTPGTIRVSFTVSRTNPSGRNEFNYAATFRGSATIRVRSE